MSTTGSCLCGAVRYELTEEPQWAHYCHCSRCRKTRGAACSANLFVGKGGFRYLQGEDHLQSYKPREALRFTHTFCRRCGSSMPWRDDTRGMVVVPMGSLDGDAGITPLANIFVESKATWFTITDPLPQYPEAPTSRTREPSK